MNHTLKQLLTLILGIVIIVYLLFLFNPFAHNVENFWSYEDFKKVGFKGGEIDFRIPSLMEAGKTYPAIVSIEVFPGDIDSIAFYILGNERFIMLRDEVGQEEFENLDSLDLLKFVDTILVSPRMQIELIDPHINNFEIASLSDDTQLLASEIPTVWEWSVKPLKRGRHIIFLKVNAKIQGTKNMENRNIEVYRKEVQISSNFGYKIATFWKNHWQWLIGTFVTVGLAILGMAVSGKLKRKKEERRTIGFRNDNKNAG